MGTSIAIPAKDSDRTYDGKTMSALGPRKRQFVIAMLQQGVNPKACKMAAAAAGYAPEYGYQLMRDDEILAALREEATKRLAGAALVGINVMLEIAQDPMHKDQYKAAKDLAAINGFTAEQKIVVEHIDKDSQAMLVKVKEMALQLGMDPGELIKSAGIIDAEFEVITPAEVDTSDW
jgi:hypothetical protein